MRLIALKKISRGGVQYQPGDELEVHPSSEWRALVQISQAALVGDISPNEARERAGLPPIDEREPLRARAVALGVDVDNRWGVARLEEEIAAAQERAAMAAEEPSDASATQDTAEEKPVEQEAEKPAEREDEPAEQQENPAEQEERPAEQEEHQHAAIGTRDVEAEVEPKAYKRRDMGAR